MLVKADHLGNVRSVIAKNVSSSAVEVLSYSDYYPHGGVLPGRNFVSSPSYKNGYQGMEKDAETNFTNFELRQLDPRLGRWFNPDPMGQYFSPYLAMGNNPVSMIDPSGGYAESGSNDGGLTDYNGYSLDDPFFARDRQKFVHSDNWTGFDRYNNRMDNASEVGPYAEWVQRTASKEHGSYKGHWEYNPQKITDFMGPDPIQFLSGLKLSERDKNKFIATVMAESDQGAIQPEAIAWVYYNRMVKEGGTSGLEGSSAYNSRDKGYKGIWYKLYFSALGESDYSNKTLSDKEQSVLGTKTIGDYLKVNEFFKNKREPILNVVKKVVLNTVLAHPEKNPYPGFLNQGYVADFNGLTSTDAFWNQARAYYWLQDDGVVTNKYVVRLPAGKNTTFIFNAEKIQEYFKANPSRLPKNVPLYDPKSGCPPN